MNPNIQSATSLHLLPMLVCGCISQDYYRALPVAAALQFMLVAGDILDDIEDDDSNESICAQYGKPVAFNAATVLIIVAELALLRLGHRGVSSSQVLRAIKIFNKYYAQACFGQHQDLGDQKKYRLTEMVCIRTMRSKSASQFECACHLGALTGGADSSVIKEFTEFGGMIGLGMQSANEIAGILDGSDITSRKITIPVIFARRNSNRLQRRKLRLWYELKDDSINPEEIAAILNNTGAVYEITVKHQRYLNDAIDKLQRIKKKGIDTSYLEAVLKLN